MNLILINQLKEGRVKKGWKQSDVEEMTGIKKNTLSNYENGVSEPDMDTFAKLCNLYDLDCAALLEEAYGLAKNEIVLKEAEKEIIKKYRSLDDYGKKAVITTLDHEVERVESFLPPFTDSTEAYKYLTENILFAMGGFDPDSMDNDELLEYANDLYIMRQSVKKK